MNGWTKAILCACLLAGALTFTTRGAADDNPPSTAQLQIRANTAFNRGEYKTALPILKKLAETFKDEPTRLGVVQEKIRVCEKALASLNTNPATQPVPADTISAETRKPHPAPRPGEVIDIAIRDLGNFDYDQEHGGNIPADVRCLSGATVRLRGFMIPIDQAENITQFKLVPSLFACCFGQPPQMQHTIFVACPKGKTVGYCPDEIVVEGTLTVQEKKDDGYLVSVFDLLVKSVKPAPQ